MSIFPSAIPSGRLNSSTIERIVTLYPQINLYWLITGKGEILLQNSDQNLGANPGTKDELLELQRAHIDLLNKRVAELEEKVAVKKNVKAG